MQKNKLLIILTIALSCHSIKGIGQSSEIIANYIYQYKQVAMAEMKRTGVPAAITLAQGIHESGAGKSELANKSNNHFGIKCKNNWTGEKVYHDDDARGECFRKYSAVLESYMDHSDFLRNGQRYAFLFDLDPEDYSGWANGLKKAGYATNPKYPQVLIKLIEEYGLQHYTLIAIGKIPDAMPPDEGAVTQPLSALQTLPTAPQEKPVEQSTATQKKITEPAAVPTTINAYPSGVFLINDTKVVFIHKGTSFFAIASEHKVDLARLFEFNDMPVAEDAPKDMLIFLQRKRKTGYNEFHTIQPGETMHDIAQKQGIRLESLRELNWLAQHEVPSPGEVLSLKKKSASIPKLVLQTNYTISGTKTY
ncbi:MAG: hypothetical protein RL115_88 [Bacteroidota bacterium]|jgi:hypothetical protein